jgi:HSP20 family protein
MATTPKETRTQEPNKHEPHKQEPSKQEPNKPRSGETALARHRDTSPVRSSTRQPLARLREEFDRLFDQFSQGMLPMSSAQWGADMREDDDNVTVRAEVPGFEPSDFDIQVRGDQLVLSATRKSEEDEEGYRGYQRSEFYEAVSLPAGVDADKVKAAYRQGVLTVTMPKTPESKGRRIAVEG